MRRRGWSAFSSARLSALGLLLLGCGSKVERALPATANDLAAGADDLGRSTSVDCRTLLDDGGPASQWVYFDDQGRLAYKTLSEKGDRVMDFSYAGYGGGGVAIPLAPVAQTLAPSGGDDTAAIQAALDAVAKLPLVGGVRGAVALAAGKFQVAGELTIGASGVVLRGAGSTTTGGTEIDLTGSAHNFVNLAGAGSWTLGKTKTTISDSYLPAGSLSFHVADAGGFVVGQTILVQRPVTAAWIHFMDMDTLVRNGMAQTWLAAGTLIGADRSIVALAGDLVTLDVPLPDSYDATYVQPGATVVGYTFPGRISQVGVEHLRVVAPAVTPPPITSPLFTLLQASAVQDGWMRDVAAVETENSVYLGATVKRFTIEDFTLTRTLTPDVTEGYPLEISYSGSQIFVQRSRIAGDDLYTFSTVSRATGPNVVLDSTATGVHTRLEPHERWATGFLADNVVHDDQLNLVNRATAGSGQGWAIGWGVLWNGGAANITVEAPPGAMNWAIGTAGKAAGDGTFDSPAIPVTPRSLYLAQLCQRLGAAALANIGDSPTK